MTLIIRQTLTGPTKHTEITNRETVIVSGYGNVYYISLFSHKSTVCWYLYCPRDNLHHGADHAVYTYVFVVEAFSGTILSHETATFPAFGFFVRVLVTWTLLFSEMAEFRCKYVIACQRFMVARYL